jgi:hypothetical protein
MAYFKMCKLHRMRFAHLNNELCRSLRDCSHSIIKKNKCMLTKHHFFLFQLHCKENKIPGGDHDRSITLLLYHIGWIRVSSYGGDFTFETGQLYFYAKEHFLCVDARQHEHNFKGRVSLFFNKICLA